MADYEDHILFDQDFCELLEYHLTHTFRNSNYLELSKLWCDGVIVPPREFLLKKVINDSRQLQTTAYIGIDGQAEFKMTIHFGPRSLRRCANGTSLVDALPSDSSTEWLTIDLDRNNIKLFLL